MKYPHLLLAFVAIVALPAIAATTPPVPVTVPSTAAAPAFVPKVVFQINVAEDAPTILRFVTNYLVAEPTAKVAVVGYGPGIDFMLKDARDPKGTPYEPQLAALTAKGVEFKVCNNTLKSRNATADVVSKEAVVVPGAVNEILRLETREGYAYFQH
jgi:intracellular sulfur oxidation DsrE/DsrF family protein